MTKSELIEQLAEQHAHIPVKDVENAVKEILEQMAGSLSSSDRIEIRGFGSFAINRRPARLGRNPRSGEKVMVPEKRTPHFKVGKALREAVDTPTRNA